ncbi:MAG: tRNA pseudouridine(55) synthase TruB [Xanthomonadales bacterium]|nr:tRNA pseudouridine(55) synthase TruB [Xanthomonadales bacterium]
MSRRRGRAINGILPFDKPAGLSSNAALQEVKRLYEARRAGHAGTLDPFATGLLPICFGEATKFSGQLLDADKTYVATARLGIATDTGDPEGEVSDRAEVPNLGFDELAAATRRFVGEIEQIPPMYSALKHRGRRLYELAREGKAVERKARRVRIDAFDLLDLDSPVCRFRIRCSKGTYVRTLVEDFAQAIGTVGHTVALRRTGVGPFHGMDMLKLEDLAELDLTERDVRLLPVDAALAELPIERLGADELGGLKFGNPIELVREPNAPPGPVRIYLEEKFLGLGELDEDRQLRPKRMVQQSKG